MNLLLEILMGIILVKIVYLAVIPRRLRMLNSKVVTIVCKKIDIYITNTLQYKDEVVTNDKTYFSEKVIPIKNKKIK